MAMIHLEPQTAEMFSRALGALKPPPNLTLSQWADNYRRLSAEASAAQGRWNTDNAPFQREIMNAIGDVHIRKVVAMMCAQSGKTDGLILDTINLNYTDAADQLKAGKIDAIVITVGTPSPVILICFRICFSFFRLLCMSPIT